MHDATPLTYVEVDLAAIAHNTRAIAAHIGPDVELIAVVKANAYGHGAVPIAQTALAHGASRLAVARVPEGVKLREAGITAPILVMGYTAPDAVATALDHDLTLTVTEWPVALRVSQRAVARGSIVPIHVKVDTGMGRLGLLPDEVLPFVERLAALPELSIEGIFSHFAAADNADKTYTRQQFALFSDVLARLSVAGHHIPLRHIANSAATFDLPDTHLDAVRVGLALYGLQPSESIPPAVSIKPALSLISHVARVRTLPAGASISYGRTYTTTQPTPVALIPVGYGDGYHRLLSNRGAVLINGQRAPIIGRVCMDQFVVDISTVGPVAVEDPIVLIGCQNGARITADDLACWAETIHYEITTSLLPRIPRRYV